MSISRLAGPGNARIPFLRPAVALITGKMSPHFLSTLRLINFWGGRKEGQRWRWCPRDGWGRRRGALPGGGKRPEWRTRLAVELCSVRGGAKSKAPPTVRGMTTPCFHGTSCFDFCKYISPCWSCFSAAKFPHFPSSLEPFTGFLIAVSSKGEITFDSLIGWRRWRRWGPWYKCCLLDTFMHLHFWQWCMCTGKNTKSQSLSLHADM